MGNILNNFTDTVDSVRKFKDSIEDIVDIFEDYSRSFYYERWVLCSCHHSVGILWLMFFKGRFQSSIKCLLSNIFRYSLHHHEFHPIVFNLIYYNKVYFDKYKYEKIDFEKVAFFLLLIVYSAYIELKKMGRVLDGWNYCAHVLSI